MASERKVDYRFKLLYAISMVLVVKEHADGAALSFLQHWFPTDGLLMGMFTFASGYFYNSKAEENIDDRRRFHFLESFHQSLM